MAITLINIGTAADDGTGDSPRAAAIKVNDSLQSLQADVDAKASAAQGQLADTAVQPADIAGFGSETVINTQTGTTYTLADVDRGAIVRIDRGGVCTVTIPTNAAEALPTGTLVIVRQLGGIVTVTGAAGVSVNGTDGGSVDTTGPLTDLMLLKVSADAWDVTGGAA